MQDTAGNHLPLTKIGRIVLGFDMSPRWLASRVMRSKLLTFLRVYFSYFKNRDTCISLTWSFSDLYEIETVKFWKAFVKY